MQNIINLLHHQLYQCLYAILKDVSGSIVADLTATSLDSSSSSITATVGSFNSTLQILKFTGATGTFQADREITFSNG